MPFEILLCGGGDLEPTDSWDVHRPGSAALSASPTASEEDPFGPLAGLPPLRKARSTVLGTEGVGECWERGPRRRRVGFSPSFLNSTHYVTPYASLYGVHPSFFNFGHSGEMRLTESGIAEDMRRHEEGLDPLMLDGGELF